MFLVLTLLGALTHAAEPGWRPAPAFVELFTPAAAPPDMYEVYVSDRDLDTLLAGIRTSPQSSRAPGAWTARPAAPSEGFGQSGSYNRWAMARLFGARRVRVARGAHYENGQAAEAWTLVSPYPDPSLRTLQPGTLLIVTRLDGGRGRSR